MIQFQWQSFLVGFTYGIALQDCVNIFFVQLQALLNIDSIHVLPIEVLLDSLESDHSLRRAYLQKGLEVKNLRSYLYSHTLLSQMAEDHLGLVFRYLVSNAESETFEDHPQSFVCAFVELIDLVHSWVYHRVNSIQLSKLIFKFLPLVLGKNGL